MDIAIAQFIKYLIGVIGFLMGLGGLIFILAKENPVDTQGEILREVSVFNASFWMFAGIIIFYI